MKSDTQTQLETLWNLLPGELAALPSVLPFLSDEPVFAQLSHGDAKVKDYDLFWHDLPLAMVRIKKTAKGFVPIEVIE